MPTAPLLTRPRPKQDVTLERRTFEQDDFSSCVEGERSANGSFLVGSGPNERWKITAGEGVISVELLISDYARRGPILGFAADAADARRLQRAIRAASTRPGSPFPARGIIVRKRGNVVLFYQRAVPAETVAITESCLGGRPWRSPPGPPPDSGFPVG